MSAAHPFALAARLTHLIMGLATIAAGVGLLFPSVYRETTWVIPQNRGQDLVTLVVLALLGPSLIRVGQGSPRATLVWLGLLGYLAYTYTGAAFAYAFNELFPAYVALFSLSWAALIASLTAIEPVAFRDAFDAATPRREAAVFLMVVAAVLTLLWMSQIIPFFTHGKLPEMIVLAGTPTVFVFVLDLGVVVPLAVVSARWLWRLDPWGYVLSGLVLVKATTMGFALLAMTAFARAAGEQVDITLAVVWITLAVAGLLISLRFFRHCAGVSTRPTRAESGTNFAVSPICSCKEDL